VLTIFSETHRLHRAVAELIDGRMEPPVEVPERAERVLAAVRSAALGPIVEPDPDDPDVRAALLAVHDEAYLAFLETAHDAWLAEGHTGDALPLAWPARNLNGPEPDAIDGRLGYWSFDAGTPVTAGTWAAATGSVRVALTGARLLLAGEEVAFALCRPPGHHAAADQFGGYCFLNNSAVAAEALAAAGGRRVAVLDVDYHHGNGTQAIFWERPDVLTISIHADPRQEYPYFTGYAGEVGGSGAEGSNRNLPLPWGTGFDRWAEALDAAIGSVAAFGADAVVVPLGVDTFRGDPISRFGLDTPDYLAVGAALARLRRPTLFVLEGGYAVDAIGTNVVNVLRGFEDEESRD
jgi:acetoin utilization deacetylase AcuC-like enzyme